MFNTLPLVRRTADVSKRRRAPRLIWIVYGVMAALVVAYLGSIIARPLGTYYSPLDGWGVDAFEFTLSCLCLSLALGKRRNRLIPLLLGAGLLSWTLGDVVITLQSLNNGTPPVPSVADVFYLLFYPLAYVGLVQVMRREIKTLVPTTWLDGLVAGLGAAAVCSCFFFDPDFLHTLGQLSHNPLGLAINLALPVGDLLLLALVMGGTATFPGRPKAQWIVLAAACVVIAIGDSFNLFQTIGNTSTAASISNGIAWPTTILLVSGAMWLRSGPTNLLLTQRTPGFLLPGLAAGGALAILVLGTLKHVPQVAVGLAIATLVIAGIRAGLSAGRLRRLTDERHRQSVTDHLTDLGNRRRMFALLDAYFADRADPSTPDRPLAFLFIDLDHFKEINDSFGHSAGDALLRQLGPRIAGALRSSDALVRVGGDELGVIITGSEPGYASAVAERLLAKLTEPFHLDSVSVRISASIGIAIAPTDASDSASLLRCADLAMYRAKVSGVPFEVYNREIDDEGSRLRLVDELRVAVEDGQFELHYQPQLDLRTGQITTVEALLRWPHPRLGMVAPLDFLPLAEEVGLMRPLTALVLDTALSQCASWRAAGRELTMSVNISITNLLDPTFLDHVRERLAHHHLPASCLVLEITETTIIKDFKGCKSVIEQMRAEGLGVSVDDFGAGFTSLAYLGNLAVSELKLDRTFIVGLQVGGESDQALVRATIELGHALGLRVVAEGIEDDPTLNLLTGMGCDLAQGYFIGRPAPASEFSGRPGFGTPLRELVGLRAS
ncbi:MAG TPA: EAL domain-containing protein [Candidatus Dormibacteraeota bacterium]|nr:EAL domain-containing protein [Candidatus Dormibacteraeota bacterium]